MSIAMQNEIDALRKRVEELERIVAQITQPKPEPVTLTLKRKNG